jgi:hypothetical protein
MENVVKAFEIAGVGILAVGSILALSTRHGHCGGASANSHTNVLAKTWPRRPARSRGAHHRRHRGDDHHRPDARKRGDARSHRARANVPQLLAGDRVGGRRPVAASDERDDTSPAPDSAIDTSVLSHGSLTGESFAPTQRHRRSGPGRRTPGGAVSFASTHGRYGVSERRRGRRLQRRRARWVWAASG